MFPLALAPFEQYFLYNDSPACPSEFFVLFEYQGQFDPDRANAALDVAGAAHWMIRSRIQLDSRGRPFWEPANVKPAIQKLPQPVDYSSRIPPIDIFSECPIKLLWHPSADSGTLVFQVHHCALDGVGFFQFFQDWWCAYQDPEYRIGPERVDPRALIYRCRPQLSVLERLRLLPGQSRSLRAAIMLLRRATVSLQSHTPPQAGQRPPAPLNYYSTRLTSAETHDLRDLAQARHSTVNNLLVSTMFATLLRWQAAAGSPVDEGHFRIMVPINERNEFTRQLPACNHCTIISVDRTANQIRVPYDLHHGIRRQMKIIKDWKLSLNFWRGLELCKWLPGGLERRLAESEVTATALLTNLGNVSRYTAPRISGSTSTASPPQLAWSNVSVIPTLDDGMAAAIAIQFVDQRLGMTLHFDETRWHFHDARALLEHFAADLRQLITAEAFAASPTGQA